jgi:hypothetical protein
MSTVIHFRCRNAIHLAAPSRRGIGGIVFRHGTAAYCDGVGVDDRHQWVATGGVPLESLIGDAHDRTRGRAGGDERLVKLSDDPDRPDVSRPIGDPALFAD